MVSFILSICWAAVGINDTEQDIALRNPNGLSNVYRRKAVDKFTVSISWRGLPHVAILFLSYISLYVYLNIYEFIRMIIYLFCSCSGSPDGAESRAALMDECGQVHSSYLDTLHCLSNDSATAQANVLGSS